MGFCYQINYKQTKLVALVNSKKMNELSDKLTTSSLGLESWLKGLGITRWLTELVKGAIILLILFVAVILVIPCLLHCLKKMINDLLCTIWLVETKKKGELWVTHWMITWS